MTSFSVEPEALDQAGARFRADVSETQRSIADQVQGSGQARLNVGDVAAAAAFQRRWYDWVQTRFEDLQAADDLLTGVGVALQDSERVASLGSAEDRHRRRNGQQRCCVAAGTDPPPCVWGCGASVGNAGPGKLAEHATRTRSSFVSV
jgi:hypothetical protein